jgi:hypothetical protein
MFVAFQATARQTAVKTVQLRFMSSVPATMKVREGISSTFDDEPNRDNVIVMRISYFFTFSFLTSQSIYLLK